MKDGKLTGRVRVRGGWFGKIVLQVEVVRTFCGGVAENDWRDATVSDLSELHNLVYSNISITVRLPDIQMPEQELPGENLGKGKLH